MTLSYYICFYIRQYEVNYLGADSQTVIKQSKVHLWHALKDLNIYHSAQVVFPFLLMLICLMVFFNLNQHRLCLKLYKILRITYLCSRTFFPLELH